ncbi:MAG: fibronectin type III domain-containing protein, partial [Flavobacteriales bacterium]|nr:fibronectin type III domain-containing protein [Flavobacteriales bacterium]
MKRITLVLLLLMLTGFGYSQTENFEGGIPGTWAVFNNGIGGNTWTATSAVTTPPTVCEGTTSAFMNARQNIGAGNTSQNYLVTPLITVPANGQLIFSTRSTINGPDNTTYQVRYSTTSQTDINSFTTIQSWADTDLTAVFNICEEKTVNISGLAGQQVYIAFVVVMNQPAATLTGDRWIVDDIRFVEQCIDPTNITVGGITQNSASVSWTNPGGATQFEVEVVEVPNAPTGVGVLTGPSPYLATGLSPTTQYQVYVRAVCSQSNSAWVGPVNFITTTPGAACNSAIQVPSLPYSTTDNTSNYQDDIDGSPGATGCGTAGNFLNGNNVYYSYTATTTGVINLTMTPTGNNSGMFVYNSCTNVGVSCVAGTVSTNGAPLVIDLPVVAGQTYYIVISTNGNPNTIPYTLSIQVVNCAPPTNLGAVGGQTSAILNWDANGATSWEYAVQLLGGVIPTGAGVQTNAFQNVNVTNLLDGTPIQAATQYQYWVRRDCGDGTFSAWAGPFPFNTTICEPSQQCNYTFVLRDSFGDGWNGATMQVRQNGIVVATLGPTFTAGGGPINITVPLCNGLPFDLFWNAGGTFPTEVRVQIINPAPFNQTLYNMTTPSAGLVNTVLYSGTVDCFNPACIPPSGVAVTNIGGTSAQVSWTPIPTVTQYEVIVLPAGSPAPTAASTGTVTTDNPFTINGLNSATLYDVYVRAICATPIPSNWTPVTTFNTTLCEVADQCLYTFRMRDSFGDGWNGARMQVRQNGIVIATIGATFNAGAGPIDVQVPLCDGIPFDLFWSVGGTFPTEVGVEIIDPFSESMYVMGFNSSNLIGTVLFNGFVNCTPPTCPKPNNLNVTLINQTGATLSWNEVGTATSWEVIVLPAGSPAPLPTDTGVIVTTNSYVVSNLNPGTSYVFYVRALCAENDLSNWSGPRAFVTQIANDNCGNAIVVPVNPDTSCALTTNGTVLGATASNVPSTCAGTADDDVWFEFVATATTHSIDLLNISGSTADLYHVLYQGSDCNNLTQLYCSDPNQSVATNLIIGQTYKIRIYTWTATPNQTSIFTVCVGTIPPPIAANTTQFTAQQLVEDILLNTTCASVSNITFSTGTNFGSTNGIGYFTQNGSSFPFEDGVVLSTGNAANSPGPNLTVLSEGATTWTGDADLEAIILAATGQPMNSRNATRLEFDFIPLTDFISFDFIFASEEYGTFQCTFSDAFAFLLTNNATGVTTNLAVVPNTNTPISVVTIRDQLYNDDCGSVNEEFFGEFFGDNGSSPLGAPINFNGMTVPMTASATVIPNTSYHIKLVIADRQDTLFDSAVFLNGGSFNIGNIELGDDFLVAQGNAICAGETVVINTGLSPSTFTFSWLLDGQVIPNETSPSLTVTSPGVYSVQAQYINTTCLATDSITIEYFDEVVPGTPNNLYFCSATGVGTFDLTSNNTLLTAPLGSNFGVTVFTSLADAQANTNAIPNPTSYVNTSNPQTVYVRVFDLSAGCFGISSFQLIVEDLTPQFTITPDFSICEGQEGSIVVTPVNYTNDQVTYTWTLDGNVLNETSNVLSVLTGGIYQVVVDFGGCTAQATTTVTVVPFINLNPVQDVIACNEFILPELTVGNYYTEANGQGEIIPSGTVITENATIYVFAANENCTDQEVFTVTINSVIVDVLPNISACDSYQLPALSANNAYYTQPGGLGIQLSVGDLITTSQTIYIYAQSGTTPNCVEESSFVVTIGTLVLNPIADVTACDSYILPALPQGNYYTQSGGLGLQLNAGDSIESTQLIYVFDEDGTCSDEISFTVIINSVSVDNLPNISVCDSYQLPVLSANNGYYTEAGGLGTQLSAGDLITTSQTIYIYAQSETIPNCVAESSFVVTVNTTPQVLPITNVTVCDSYTLPNLTIGNYYTGPGGTGTQLAVGQVLTSSQTIYVFAQSGTIPNCFTETSFVLTVNSITADVRQNVTVCDSFVLTGLSANNAYYTAPNGGGTQLAVGTSITSTQTIYIYAQTGTTPNCTAETSFTVTVNTAPSVDVIQNATVCLADGGYILPSLPANNSYFTGPNGSGLSLAEGSTVSSSQTIYIYAQSGTVPNCTAESSFTVTVVEAVAQELSDVQECGGFVLPSLDAGNVYY